MHFNLINGNYFRVHEYHYGKFSWNLVGIYFCWRCLGGTFKRQLWWDRVGCQLGKGKRFQNLLLNGRIP